MGVACCALWVEIKAKFQFANFFVLSRIFQMHFYRSFSLALTKSPPPSTPPICTSFTRSARQIDFFEAWESRPNRMRQEERKYMQWRNNNHFLGGGEILSPCWEIIMSHLFEGGIVPFEEQGKGNRCIFVSLKITSKG